MTITHDLALYAHTFNNQIWYENFNFLFFLFLIFFVHYTYMCNSKTMRYRQTFYIPMTAMLLEILLFWFWMVSYGRQTVPPPPSKQDFLCQHFFGFMVRIPGVTQIVRPHPDTEQMCYRLQQVLLAKV